MIKKKMTGSQQDGRIYVRTSFDQRTKGGTKSRYDCSDVLPPGVFASPGLPVFPSWLPGFLISSCFVCGVAPNPRIL